jgi:predicted transcriptional regulator
MPVSDICNTKVVKVDKDTSIVEVARLMRDRNVGSVVLTEKIEGKQIPTGIITDRDLTLEIIASEADPTKLSAGDIVIHSVIVVDENEGIFETLHRMRSHGVRRLPVVDRDGALTGIVSADDMIEYIAEEMKELAKMIAVELRYERNTVRMSYAAGVGLEGNLPIM